VSSLRLGLAGCGRIAERGYAPAVAGLPGVKIVAVADPDRDRARNAAAAAGRAVAFDSVAELLGAGGVDALVVAVPAADHVAVAGLAAEAGVPSLVEKPPAPDLAGARALAALDPAPALAFNRRFLQGAELAARVPAEGWLEMELELRFRRGAWAAHACRDDALLDAGVHLVDLAAFLSGSAPIAVRDASVGAERAELELELGRARARIVCATDRRYRERVELVDRAGRRLARSTTSPGRARLHRLRGGEDPLVESLRLQLERFAEAVRGEDPGPLAGAAAGVAAMGAIEAARRSADLAGAEVTVAPAAEAAPR
jgi:predicted dehydrogenase